MDTTPPELRSTTETRRRKGFLFPSLCLALVVNFLPVPAMAEWESIFTVPPYSLNESVAEIDGWEMVYKDPHPVHVDPMMASVIDSPVIGATQPTTLELKTMLKNMGPKIEELGDRFVVETQFAVAFNSAYNWDSFINVRFGSTNERAPFHFGFYYGEEGGLYYQGRGGRVIVLPKSHMLEDVAYKFLVQVDWSNQTFRVVVTSPGDDTFRHESEEVQFQEAFETSSNLHGIFLSNHAPSVTAAYVDYVKVVSSLE